MTRPNAEIILRDLRELEAVRSSRGWQLVVEALKQEALSLAFSLADDPNMPDAAMHFRRGAIAASRSHLSLLDTIISIKQGEATLAAAASTGEPPQQPDASA